MTYIDLNGDWKMRKAGESSWLDATVPGSVYNDLLAAGAMPDPFFRDNEYIVEELSNFDYEYQKTFTADADILENDLLLLVCEGLDTLSNISVNGVHVASTNNMHRTYEFDIKTYLKPGINSIMIKFNSPLEYVTRKDMENRNKSADDAVSGTAQVRKAHYMFGWDWGPKLPDMGIWRNISIQCFKYGKIDDVIIHQEHADGKVVLDIGVALNLPRRDEPDIMVEVRAPSGEIIQKQQIPIIKAEGNVIIRLNIENPLLWWPNNYGAQPLYTVSVILKKNETTLDSRSLRIGLRTIAIRREKDAWGESFEFVINGVGIFAMGADYIPEDSILARRSRERTQKLIKSCVDANFNSIRVWGGGIYPPDYFYDLCDEYGLIVWQDLMYACNVYRLDDEFKENITHETIDNIKRLRHHASLGLWCGNNEQEEGWVVWGWLKDYSDKLKEDYIRQYEELFPELVKKTSPDTFYWPSSPSSGGNFNEPNSENAGDMHYWQVWHGKEPYTAYRKIFPRFMSEFGLQSFPCMKTVLSFTLPEDRNIFSYVMESHQKDGTCNEKILYYIGENYKYPKDFDSLLYVSQLIQAEGLRYGVEHWRRNRGRCAGAIYWQLNDCWPVASWASIDYYGRYKALHYAAKRFFTPVLASACEEGTTVSMHVTNETTGTVTGTIKWSLRDAESNILLESEKPVNVECLSSKEIIALDFSAELNSIDKKRNTYLEFCLYSGSDIISSGTVLFVKAKHFSFFDPRITLDICERNDSYIITVESRAFAKFVELDFKECDAVFSDNYFDLSQGQSKIVEVRKSELSKPLTLDEMRKQLKARSLYDTWEK